MSAETVTNAVRDAISAGHRQFTVAAQVGRIRGEWPADLIGYELGKSKQDLYRSAAIELLMTRAEIEARYEFSEVGPFSAQWEEGEEDESIQVPLERADYCGYLLSLYPRRHPLPGAVYVARQPLEGEQFSVDAMHKALRRFVVEHFAYPQELRINHEHYTDYLNAMHDLIPRGGILGYINEPRPPDEPITGATFNGIPINPQRRAPRLMLLAVYPLPGIGG